MKRVAVLRGGPSEEYAVSMETGKGVLNALRGLQYPTRDIVITRQGEWLYDGIVRTPQQLLEGIDVVFIALHGHYGEDGQVQRILERNNIPFTGSRSLPSAIAFNKELTKRTLQSHGIAMPRHRRFGREEVDNIAEAVPQIVSDIGKELFVKPIASGSSVGAYYVPNQERLHTVLEELLQQHEQVLIEEFIRGREATVGVLNDFRNESLYILPVVEIVPPNGKPLFSYDDKYNGQTEEIVPGRFTYHEKSKLGEIAALVHDVIECQNYSRSDFIVRNGEVYFLEVNTLPGLTSESLFPKAAAAIGLEYPQLIQHLVETAQV
ncbi:MAG: D-alanine--D-alanine ligase [Candidatus Kaiserbacteria bacterium]|nr:D-alanine--D-alanine ligase [Candidatus Kaiserbacteria bacterium]MCB9815970.1 D-alanine--D-alanine ligase [Candidatus Nomurabacteria bacterium]